MSLYDSPFKDAVGKDSVPERGSKGGVYDSSEAPGTPGRDSSPNALAELHRDTAATSKSPSKSGPVKTPYKDSVD